MKNLYKIKVLHGAPKDSHTSIETYLLAESDEDIYKFIDKKYLYGRWKEMENNEDIYYDEDLKKDVTSKEWIMKNQGDLEDESGWEDAYYGVTKYGWEFICAITEEAEKILKSLDIVKEI